MPTELFPPLSSRYSSLPSGLSRFGDCTTTPACLQVRAPTCVLQIIHDQFDQVFAAAAVILLSLALREQLGLLLWCVYFQARQPRPGCECSNERPLLESLSLGIQQRGKQRAKTGQDPRALHMNNCKWEKDAPRDRVGGKL